MGDFSFDCAKCELPVVGDGVPGEDLKPFARAVQINENNDVNSGVYDSYGRLDEDVFAFVIKGRNNTTESNPRDQFFQNHDENSEDIKIVHEMCFDRSMTFDGLRTSPSGQEYTRLYLSAGPSPYQTGIYARYRMEQYAAGHRPLDCRSDGIKWDELDEIGSALYHYDDSIESRESLDHYMQNIIIPALADYKQNHNLGLNDRPFGRYLPDQSDLREGFDAIGVDGPDGIQANQSHDGLSR